MRLRKLSEIIQTIDIFNFDYPMIAEHRKEFERNFMLHYYNYYINYESVSEFLQRLQSRLCTIMPKYVKLYETENMITDPFVNFFTKTTYNEKEDRKLITDYIESQSEETLQKLMTALKSMVDEHGTTISEGYTTGNTGTEGNEVETYKEDETYSRDRTVNTTEDTDKQVDQSIKTDTQQVTDSTETTVTDRDQTTTLNETENTDKETVEKFSDTPQINFVVGNSRDNGDGTYTPISSYATTLTDTTEDTTRTLNSTEEVDEDTTSTVTTEKTVDTDTTTTTERTEDEVKKIDTQENIADTTHTEGGKETQTTETIKSTGTDETNIETTGQTATQSNSESRTDKRTDKARTSNTDTKTDTSTAITTENRGFMNSNISTLLQSYRDTLINIDLQIINDCSNLFLGVWNYD